MQKTPSMAIDEQEAAIAGLLKARSQARWRRAELENELRAAGKSLCEIGGALKNLSGRAMGSRTDHILSKVSNVPTICELNQVKEMLEELKELQTRLDDLNCRVSQTGIG